MSKEFDRWGKLAGVTSSNKSLKENKDHYRMAILYPDPDNPNQDRFSLGVFDTPTPFQPLQSDETIKIHVDTADRIEDYPWGTKKEKIQQAQNFNPDYIMTSDELNAKYLKSTPSSLNENVVGIGSINPIFAKRDPEKYETAFEHFLSERYEEKEDSCGGKDSLDEMDGDRGPDAHSSEEFINRIEGLANTRDLKLLHDMLRILSTDWFQEGFEKEDIKEYISLYIDQI